MKNLFIPSATKKNQTEYYSQMIHLIETNCSTPLAILNKDEIIIWSNDAMNSLINLSEGLSWEFHLENSFVSSNKKDFFKKMLISKKKTGKVWDVKSSITNHGRLVQLIDFSEYVESFKDIKNEEILTHYDLGQVIEEVLEDLSSYISAKSIHFDLAPTVTMIRPAKKDVLLGFSTFVTGTLNILTNQKVYLTYKNEDNYIKLAFEVRGLEAQDYSLIKEGIAQESAHYFRRVESILEHYSPEVNIIKLVNNGNFSLKLELSLKNLPHIPQDEMLIPPIPYDA